MAGLGNGAARRGEEVWLDLVLLVGRFPLTEAGGGEEALAVSVSRYFLDVLYGFDLQRGSHLTHHNIRDKVCGVNAELDPVKFVYSTPLSLHASTISSPN